MYSIPSYALIFEILMLADRIMDVQNNKWMNRQADGRYKQGWLLLDIGWFVLFF